MKRMACGSTERPAGRAEVLRERIHRDHVLGNRRHQRTEAFDEGAVHVVGDDHEPRVRRRDDLGDARARCRGKHHRRWVRRVDDEQRAHRRVSELVDLRVGELPCRAAVVAVRVRVDLHDLVVVAVESRDLEIRRECRNHQRDLVALFEQTVGRQAVEDVTHRRGAAFDREQVERHLRSHVGAHLGGEVLAHDLLGVHEHPVGTGVMVADDAVGQLVDPCVGIEPAVDSVVDERP